MLFFLYDLRNLFIKPFFHYGETLVCFKKHKDNYLYKNFTIGKIYYSENRDYISYYIKDDNGKLQEISKNLVTLIKIIK